MSHKPATTTEWVVAALQRYEVPLLRYAARITKNPETARDVVQETFLRLCEENRVKVDGHLASWLYKVCRNKALNLRRKENRNSFVPSDQMEGRPSNDLSPLAVAAQNETQAMVLEIVKSLPHDQQEAFSLKFWDDLTYREISQVMGVSLGKVSNLITTALKAIRRKLQTESNMAQEV